MARRVRRTRRAGSGDFLAIFSLIIIIVLGFALATVLTFRLLGHFTPAPQALLSVALWVERLMIALALSIPLVFSFREAKLRGGAWFVLWIISLILIIVCYVFGIVGLHFGWWF